MRECVRARVCVNECVMSVCVCDVWKAAETFEPNIISRNINFFAPFP